MKELSIIGSEKKILLDDDDYYRFRGFNWHLKDDGYVICDSSKPRRREGISAKLRIHRLILACDDGLDVDHINGNKLDNRKCNLRLVTRSENLANRDLREHTGKLTGAHFNKSNNKWFATIGYKCPIRGRKYNQFLGYYPTEEECHQVYRKRHIEIHGDKSVYWRQDANKQL